MALLSCVDAAGKIFGRRNSSTILLLTRNAVWNSSLNPCCDLLAEAEYAGDPSSRRVFLNLLWVSMCLFSCLEEGLWLLSETLWGQAWL